MPKYYILSQKLSFISPFFLLDIMCKHWIKEMILKENRLKKGYWEWVC